MKKIYILLAALIFIVGCDDGDMTFKSFNFANGPDPAQCATNLSTVYQINGTEALVMNLSESLFLNVASAKNEAGVPIPTVVDVGGSSTYTMYYRNYSGNVNRATLCESSGTPNIVEQWTGNGKLNIITTANTNDDGKITGYSHQILIESATFSKGDQEVTIINNLLGSFTTNLDINFEFEEIAENEPRNPARCTNNTSILYKINADEALQLKIAPSYFTSQEAQSIPINTNNDDGHDVVFYFIKYVSSVGSNVICTPSQTDTRQEQLWIARSGTLEITYENNKHVMRFQNLILYNNNSQTEVYTPLNNDGDKYWFGEYSF